MSETLTPKEIALQHLKGSVSTESTELTDDQKKAAEAKAEEEKLAAEATAAEVKKKEDEEAAKLQKEKEELEAKNKPAELNDDVVLNYLKSKNINVSKLEELAPKPAEEDKIKKQEERDSEKLTYGLKKGLFNTKQYESFIADSKNKTELVFNAELAEAKKEDPDWNDDKEKEFREEFNDKFGVNADPSSRKFKSGQNQLNIISDSLLKSTYSSIYKLDSEFDRHEQELNSKKEFQQKVLAQAPIYKQDVETIVAGLSKISVPLGGENFDVDVSKEYQEDIKNLLLDQDFTTAQIKKGHTKEGLQDIATNLLKTKYFNELSHEAAKKYLDKHQKGVRGIPEKGKTETGGDPLENLTDKQKEALNYFKGVAPAIAN